MTRSGAFLLEQILEEMFPRYYTYYDQLNLQLHNILLPVAKVIVLYFFRDDDFLIHGRLNSLRGSDAIYLW